MANSIILRTVDGSPRRIEGVVDEAVTPGHLLERGGSNDLQKHATENGTAQRIFALENDLVGDDIDDAYASGEAAQAGAFQPGDEIQAWLAYGENVALGAALSSAGDGTLHALAGTLDERVVGYAREAKNNTTGGSAVRIKIEVA